MNTINRPDKMHKGIKIPGVGVRYLCNLTVYPTSYKHTCKWKLVNCMRCKYRKGREHELREQNRKK